MFLFEFAHNMQFAHEILRLAISISALHANTNSMTAMFLLLQQFKFVCACILPTEILSIKFKMIWKKLSFDCHLFCCESVFPIIREGKCWFFLYFYFRLDSSSVYQLSHYPALSLLASFGRYFYQIGFLFLHPGTEFVLKAIENVCHIFCTASGRCSHWTYIPTNNGTELENIRRPARGMW